MRRYLAPGLLIACAGAAAAPGPAMATTAAEVIVHKYDAAAGTVGPAANFTGQVRVELRFQAQSPARVGGGTVTFSRAPVPLGTRTRSARRSSSPPDAALCKMKAERA